MGLIALRYTSEPLDVLMTFEISAEQQETFSPSSFLPNDIVTTEEIGVMRNGRKFSHLYYTHFEYNIVLPTPELTAAKVTFFKAFWLAPYKYISEYQPDAEEWYDYKEVQTEGGKCPIEYVDGKLLLPRISFKLSTVNPV